MIAAVEAAVKYLKGGKSPGAGHIPAELITRGERQICPAPPPHYRLLDRLPVLRMRG